jgi:WD40 repeat protein
LLGASLPRTVVFYAAALGILQDPVTRTQRYFRGHTDDIVSMAVHKGASCEDTADALVATGQQGIGATYVWEVPSMRTLAVLKTKQKNVHLLEFSRDGKKLISISEDLQVAVSDWKSSTVLAITKGDAGATLHVAAGPSMGNLTFLTCGDKNIRLWTLNGRNLTAAKVVTSTCPGAKIQLHLCAAQVHGKYLVGCDDGAVYVIPPEGKGVKAFFEHHTSEAKAKLSKNGASITAMHVQHAPERDTSSGSLLFTGSKNGTVVVWDVSDLATKDRPTKRYTIDVATLGVEGLSAKQIQSIYMYTSAAYLKQHAEQPLLLIATRGCDVLEVTCDLESSAAKLYQPAGGAGKSNSKDRSTGIVMQAHCNDELWGVAAHPTRPEYCTVGKLRGWWRVRWGLVRRRMLMEPLQSRLDYRARICGLIICQHIWVL